ncbi:MAG: glycosyltransferase family 9 protein [Alphaproteobacteria bacterium]|nr:glycosyltransferase family 9 protein [Alphaproteobacteria bacterium]
MRILFITATRLGDAVLSTGLLSHLIARYPEARLTIAAGPAAAALFRPVPGVDQVIALPKMPFGGHWLKLWRRCATRRWDIVVDLRRSLIAWCLWNGQRFLLPKNDAPMHRVELLGDTLDLRAAPPPPRIWIDDADAALARDLISDQEPVLAVGPAANWRGKQWRIDRFRELAERLTAPDGMLPGARIAVFAAGDERRQVTPMLDALPDDRLIDAVGRYDLPQIAAILRRCRFFVGNDSGLMHMAAAGGISTLGLFGPSREEHYAPWGTHTAWVRTPESYEELVGRPGYDHRTTDTLMDGLSVDRAEQAACELWQRCGQTSE